MAAILVPCSAFFVCKAIVLRHKYLLKRLGTRLHLSVLRPL
jgi:hypothetical protein